MSDESIRLERDDVSVQEIFDECEYCTAGPATHVVMMDLRSAGMQTELGRYCKECAEKIAARVRDGLA